MRLANLTSGLPFKAALWATLVFWMVCLGAGAVLIKSIETSLVYELQAQAEGEAVLLAEIYQETGQKGLAEAMRATARSIPPPERLAGLFDDNGISLVGPISLMPDFVGTVRREISSLTVGKVSGGYVLHVAALNKWTLVVGRSDRPVVLARARLTLGLIAFAAFVALALLALGLWASHVSLQRLEGMEAALRRVGGGDTGARLPVHGSDDQFDRVSIRVNQNLDHLERAVTGMKETASAIAHDLKTPLSHVQIALHEAADAVEHDQDPLPKIETALQETEGLNGIFEAVLRISHIRANAGNTGFAPVSLTDIAEKTVEFLGPLAEQNHQTLTLERDGASPVHGDVGMIQQAVVNLVKNAIVHAGHDAQIDLRISARSLEVRDTGPGVQDVELERLLEPFARADAARGSEGSGLGLALVKAVADHHGASLILRNLLPGFSVTLIFAEDVEQPETLS